MKKNIVVIILLVAIIGVVFYLKSNSNSEELEYSTIKMGTSINAKSNIINDYDDFAKIVKKADIEQVTKNYKKITISEIYNEDFFESKELAYLQVYQDTSKDYISKIEKVEYNDTKTEVTITYSNSGTYSGTNGKSWYYTYFIELDKTVTKVNFVFDNSTDKD